MIGLTKLLCGKATVSEALRTDRRREPHLLQFSPATGPMVVWNVTARCNLQCVHCYAQGPVGDQELSTAEACGLIDDLAALGVPVLLFSGGEPLLRQDIFDLIAYARSRDLRPSLSTNGTLIDERTARRLAEVGVAYVGVSLDGLEATHDRFRLSTARLSSAKSPSRRPESLDVARDREPVERLAEGRAQPGVFAHALAGLRAARDAGLKTGIRFTVTRDNVSDLPGLLALVERERIPRFCLYHLVYAGRGRGLRERDLSAEERRRVIEDLMEATVDWCRRGVEVEVLTTDNHADGVLVLRYVEAHQPERAAEVRELLRLAGGCSAGRKFAQVDPWGNVHPCQFWPEVSLGNVRERPFSQLWRETSHETVAQLRRMPASLTGERCGRCVYREYCGGCRVRALWCGDEWGDDPSCPLSEEELLAPAPQG